MEIFGFDFSIAKPAMCYYNTKTKEMKFFCWPSNVDKKTIDMLSAADVNVFNRGLDPLSKNTVSNGHEMVVENTKRAFELSALITETIINTMQSDSFDDVVVVSEGLSFGSMGNRTLDLSGYKYTLLTTLYRIGVRKIFTYTPTTIKKTASHGRKMTYDKEFMISEIKNTDPTKHKFIRTLVSDDTLLKKKTTYVKCVDDLVDSYWATRTFCEEQNITDLN